MMTTLRPYHLKLRCYAEREQNGTWFALCLDLNLYARADSAEAAKAKLHEIIHDYIVEAFTVDAAYFDQLIPRPAPWLFWLHYSRLFLLSWLFPRSAFRFFDHLPLVPI